MIHSIGTKRIGIVGAMPEEIELIKKMMVISKIEEIGNRQYIIGTLYWYNIVLVFSRWGKVAASSTVTTLLDRFDVDFLLFTGVAGAIKEGLNVGDIVIGSEFVQHDMDVSSVPGMKKYEIPLLGLTKIMTNKKLVTFAKNAIKSSFQEKIEKEISAKELLNFGITKPRVFDGLILSGDQFVASNDKLNELRADLNEAFCIEMEGAAVAQVAYERKVPCLVLRIISDNADHNASIDFSSFCSKIASMFTLKVVQCFLEEMKKSRYDNKF